MHPDLLVQHSFSLLIVLAIRWSSVVRFTSGGFDSGQRIRGTVWIGDW